MAEYMREFKVTVYRDTNKATHEDEYTTAFEAIVALAPRLDADEALAAIHAIAEAQMSE